VHIDESAADFIIISKAKAVFIRSIPLGAGSLISDAENSNLKFSEEIRKSLEAYQNEDIDKIPNLLVLTGAITGVKGLESILNNTLHVPIKIMPYSGIFNSSDTSVKRLADDRYVSFLGVIAPFMLGIEKLKIELVPEEVKVRKALEDRGKELIRAGIFLLTVFVLIFSIFISKIYFKSIYLGTLKNKYKALNEEAGKLEKDFGKIGLLSNYLSGRGYSLDVLTELYSIVPLGLQISDIRFDNQAKFFIRGTAESMSVVFAFVDSMEKSTYFRDARTKYTTKRREGSRDVTDFEVIASLEAPPQAAQEKDSNLK